MKGSLLKKVKKISGKVKEALKPKPKPPEVKQGCGGCWQGK